MTRVLEICVDNFESAVAALNGGANRLELCTSLDSGGLTPSPGLLKQIQVINKDRIPIYCMLRCRPGGFIYNEAEIEIMVTDTKELKKFGADGFVFGALLENGDVDLKKCREIVKTAYPLPVTFHRAFDLCRNQGIQMESIIDLGFQRILTSGAKKTAVEGCDVIKKLMERAGRRIVIMPGSGIDRKNIKQIMEETDAREFHGSFKVVEEKERDAEDFLELGDISVANSEHIAQVMKILNL